jgi:hypothetical protein
VDVVIARWFEERCRLQWDGMSSSADLFEDFRRTFGGKKDYLGRRINSTEFISILEE